MTTEKVKMNELTAVNLESMTSLEIAEVFGKEHRNVLAKMRELEPSYIAVFGDALGFKRVEYNDAKGEKRPMFRLNKSQSLFVASRFDPALHAKVQKRWEELESTSVVTPQTFIEAMILATNTAIALEAKKLELEAKTVEGEQLRSLAMGNFNACIARDEKIEEDAPKVAFADRIVSNGANMMITAAAKLLSDEFGVVVGPNKLMNALRTHGYLMVGRSSLEKNQPYQKYINKGWFVWKEVDISESVGYGKHVGQTMITPLGLSKLAHTIVSWFRAD